MKKSHRVGLSIEDEYGEERANEIRNKIKEKREEQSKKVYQYKCSNCGDEFNNTGPLPSKIKYCSDECRYIIRECLLCGKEVKNKRGDTNIPKNPFCCKEHYYKWLRDGNHNADPRNAWKNSNNPQALKKIRETSIKNGHWHDYDNLSVKSLEWFEYSKVARGMLNKVRKQIFESWDGYDYYTGEYIKDNLKLDYRNREYPTIDHKISVRVGYERGMNIKNIISVDNLVITTKSNNSKKYNLSETDFKKKLGV